MQAPCTVAAWLEPKTVSVGLYFTCALLRGRVAMKGRGRLRSAVWEPDVLIDEFSDYLCDHTECLLPAILAVHVILGFEFGILGHACVSSS